MQLCTGNPNQVWEYDEPDEFGNNCHVEMTEEEIINKNFNGWAILMYERGLTNEITFANCIDDWIIVNWATKKVE